VAATKNTINSRRKNLKMIMHSSRWPRTPATKGNARAASAVEMGRAGRKVVGLGANSRELVTLDFNAPLKNPRRCSAQQIQPLPGV